MRFPPLPPRPLLTAAIGAALALMISVSAFAQDADDDDDYEDKAASKTSISGGAAAASERARMKRQAKQEEQAQSAANPSDFPQSTRAEPEARASSKGAAKLKAMVEVYQAKDYAKARQLADAILGDAKSSPYEKAFAAQSAAYSAYEGGDVAGAQRYFDQAVDLDALDNNGHFGAMYTLAQLQLQDEKYTDALATIERFLTESKSSNPEHLVLKGNALYRMEKFADAASVLKQAIAASPSPRADWQALLMGALAESGDTEQAARVAAEVAAKSPADKRSQMNLVAIYQQAGKEAEAVALLEKLRAAGQLTEERDYRLLYSMYFQLENKEAQAIAVINEGLAKGLLTADYNTQLALAQAYYFSDQMPKAIEAYQKAAPLAKDGETYLNLAKVLWQSGRAAEAKEAARQAKAKGLKNPGEADKVIANAGK